MGSTAVLREGSALGRLGRWGWHGMAQNSRLCVGFPGEDIEGKGVSLGACSSVPLESRSEANMPTGLLGCGLGTWLRLGRKPSIWPQNSANGVWHSEAQSTVTCLGSQNPPLAERGFEARSA